MFVVDTNILIYAANKYAPESDRCYAALEEWRKQQSAWYLTWSICFEFMRLATHRRTFREPWPVDRAWEFIQGLRRSPALKILVPTDRYATALEQTFRELPFLSGNDIHDAAIAALMREHGVKTIYTRDMRFHRFPFLEVIDPTR